MKERIMTLEEIYNAIEQGRALIAVCPETGKKSTPLKVDGDLIHTDKNCIPYSDILEGVFKIYPGSR